MKMIPPISKPLKKFIGLTSMCFLGVTSLTGIYNYASAKMDERKQPIVMAQAATCEAKLKADVKGGCTIDEQKALIARGEFEQREWRGISKAGLGVVLIMAAF